MSIELTPRGAELRGLIDAAPDWVLWHAGQLAAACHSPLEADAALRGELAPLLAPLGPVVVDGYVKDLGKLFGVGTRAVREALQPGKSIDSGPEPKGGAGKSGQTPPDGADTALEDELQRFGKEHFKTWFGSASYVGRETTDDDGRATVDFVTSGDLTRYYSHVKIRTWDERREQYRSRDLAKEWLDWPGCRTFERVVFKPQGAARRGSYNLWRGFAVAPAAGDCSLYWAHVRDVVCAGDPELYAYVRKWLAHSVQRVAELPEVALVLRGLQGTGKGWFVRPMSQIFGSHALTVQSMEHVSGRFNAHLKDVVLLFADEAFWGGDRSREGLIKALITEKARLVEPKNKDAQQVDSYTRLILATNSEWPVAMDADDRRILVLDVAPEQKENAAYFQALGAQMSEAGGGTAALMHDLLAEDLSGWHPRDRPRRANGIDIKLRSASAVAQWWHQCLVDERNASTSEQDGSRRDIWNECPVAGELHADYRRWCERLNRKYVESPDTWGREMRGKLAPHVVIYRGAGNPRPRHYTVGTVAQCREAFERFLCCGPELWADGGEPAVDGTVPF